MIPISFVVQQFKRTGEKQQESEVNKGAGSLS
jgi:hypothetical protein